MNHPPRDGRPRTPALPGTDHDFRRNRGLSPISRGFPRLPGCAAWLAPLSLVLSLLCALPASANEYSPRGLYEIEHRVLANGLRVVLKPRGDARNVSVRVRVKVGMLDFPCGRRETPHFLEHLLFTGTRRHGESALDEQIRAWGGAWNATTSLTETIYELDIFSGHFEDGLGLLHEILTESTLSAPNVELSREIIRREAGETPGPLRRWTYAHGIGKSANDKWLETVGLTCRELETPDAISRDDILRAYRRYYVPGNMALVIVGAFDAGKALPLIERTFGRQPARKLPPGQPLLIAQPPTAMTLESNLTNLLGTEAEVMITFTTSGYRKRDHFAVYLLKRHLDTRVYESLRVQQGLSYTPQTGSESWPDAGLLWLHANSSLGQIDRVRDAMREEIRKLHASPLDDDAVKALKQEALLASASDYETNADIADYYVASLHELEDGGTLVNEEDALMAVNAEDLRRATRDYLDLGHAVTVIERPLLAYETLYLALALLACGSLGFLGWRWRAGARRRRAIIEEAG